METILTVAALAPAIILMIYVYKKDRVEKEPISLILVLFGLGMLSCIPAAYMEIFMKDCLNGLFENRDKIYIGEPLYYVYYIVRAFLIVALVEEGLKWLIMYFCTRKNKNFNSYFDGVVYGVVTSLGFAAFENIKYVKMFGVQAAVSRFFISVPGHMFFGVLMGYYYSMWALLKRVDALENKLVDMNELPKTDKNNEHTIYLVLSYVIPLLAHGAFDYCLFINTDFSMGVFYSLLTVLYAVCFGRVIKMSRSDAYVDSFASSVIYERYGISVLNFSEEHGDEPPVIVYESSDDGEVCGSVDAENEHTAFCKRQTDDDE